MMLFYASFVHIVKAKLGQASAGDNVVELKIKCAPDCVPTVTQWSTRLWTTAPASIYVYVVVYVYYKIKLIC